MQSRCFVFIGCEPSPACEGCKLKISGSRNFSGIWQGCPIRFTQLPKEQCLGNSEAPAQPRQQSSPDPEQAAIPDEVFRPAALLETPPQFRLLLAEPLRPATRFRMGSPTTGVEPAWWRGLGRSRRGGIHDRNRANDASERTFTSASKEAEWNHDKDEVSFEGCRMSGRASQGAAESVRRCP